MSKFTRTVLFILGILFILACSHDKQNGIQTVEISEKILQEVKDSLLGIHGEMHKERIMKGTRQLAGNWIAEEEGKESFKNFCLENFLSGEELQKNFLRISRNMEMLDGHTKWIRHYYFESEAFTDTEELGVDPYYRKSLPHADPVSYTHLRAHET